MKNMIGLAGLCVLMAGFFGCTKKLPDGMPTLYPCTLVMLQDGKPTDDVLVRLYPEDKSLVKWTAGGISGKNGEAVMVTLGQYKGAPAGKYKVTALKTILTNKEGVTLTPEQQAEGVGIPQVKTVYVNPKYEFESSTDLTVEIKPEKNRVEIELGPPLNQTEESYNPNKLR
ncbi:MAG: hypothetical protein LBQ54_05355 [Planctomycetaceae bacterium]|nr:hypothetical protein [Planctomycetaceae bacterium]